MWKLIRNKLENAADCSPETPDFVSLSVADLLDGGVRDRETEANTRQGAGDIQKTWNHSDTFAGATDVNVNRDRTRVRLYALLAATYLLLATGTRAAEAPAHVSAFAVDTGTGVMTAMKSVRRRPLVLAGFDDGRICCVDLESRRIISELRFPGRIYALETSHDESTWAAISSAADDAEIIIGNFPSDDSLVVTKSLCVKRKTESLHPSQQDRLHQGHLLFSDNDAEVGCVLRDGSENFALRVFRPALRDSPLMEEHVQLKTMSVGLPRFTCRQLVFFGDDQVAWINSANQRASTIKILNLNGPEGSSLFGVEGAALWLLPRYDRATFCGSAGIGSISPRTGRVPSYSLFEFDRQTGKAREQVFDFGQAGAFPIQELDDLGAFVTQRMFGVNGGYRFQIQTVHRSATRTVFDESAEGFGFGSVYAIVSDSRQNAYAISPRRRAIAKIDLTGEQPPVVTTITETNLTNQDAQEFQFSGRSPAFAVVGNVTLTTGVAHEVKSNLIRALPLTDEMSDE